MVDWFVCFGMLHFRLKYVFCQHAPYATVMTFFNLSGPVMYYRSTHGERGEEGAPRMYYKLLFLSFRA